MSAPPDSCLGGFRRSEGMESTRRRAASPHSGHTAAGYGLQQCKQLFEILVLIYFSFGRCLHVCKYLYFFQENSLLRCSTVSIDP